MAAGRAAFCGGSPWMADPSRFVGRVGVSAPFLISRCPGSVFSSLVRIKPHQSWTIRLHVLVRESSAPLPKSSEANSPINEAGRIYEQPDRLRGSKWATFSQGLRPRARRLLCNRIAIDQAPLRRRNSTTAKEINRATWDREQRKAETQGRRAGPKIWPKSPPFPDTGKDGPPKSVNLQKSLRHPRESEGDSGRAGPEVGGGEGTPEESPPAGRVTDETDYLRLADHSLGVCPITRTPLGNTSRLMARGGCWVCACLLIMVARPRRPKG